MLVDVPDTDAVHESQAIQFDDLPAVDQQKLQITEPIEEAIGFGTTLIYTDAEREQSVLVPESEYSYITWENGTTAEWVVDDARDTTMHTYDYTATEVANAADYGQQMREEVAFELSGLPAAQQEIVETAISDKYIGPPYDEQPSDAFTALANQFRRHDKVFEGDYDDIPLAGAYIVQYQGSVYWTSIEFYGDFE